MEGATRQQHVRCDIMIGEKFSRTFRGYISTRPSIDENGGCVWRVNDNDLRKAIFAKWPSLENKKDIQFYPIML